MRHFATVWAVTAAGIPVPAAAEHRLRPLTRWLRDRGQRTPAPVYLEAVGELRRFARAALAAFAPYDVVLTPTLALPPVPLGYFTASGDPADEFEKMNAFTPFGNIANITGQPAVNVPSGTTADGLPLGMMLLGRIGAEATLISLSAQLEAARPWRDRTPEVWHR
jgi:amidase